MRNPRRREREGKEERRVGAERRRKADEGTAIMDNVLSSGVPRSWKRVTIVEDLTPLQCVVMRKHPITTLGMEREREAWNIFLRVSTGTIMSILRRAIGSYNRAHIWLRKGVEPWGDTRRDPACHRDAHPDFYRLEGSRYRSVFGRVPPL